MTEQNWQKISDSKTFYFYEEAGMGRSGYTLYSEKDYLGFVINPFEDVYVNDFIVTLAQYLNSAGKLVTREGAGPALSIEGVEVLEKTIPSQSNVFSIKIPVIMENLGWG